jgi:hypothetical protein
LEPSQIPWHPGPFGDAQLLRAPWGSPATAEHVPTSFGTSQASHCPSHAASQQTPSTQWLFTHASACVHGDPAGSCAAQVCVAVQKAPGAQSVSLAQVVVHAPFWQLWRLQEVVTTPKSQPPYPSHVSVATVTPSFRQ